MRIRAIVTFAVVLVSAAVGLAMTSAANSAAWEPAGQGRRADPGPPTPGPPPGRPGAGPGGIERLLFQLDLTAAQLEQVKSLMQAQREASAPYQQALRDIGNQMRQAVESAGFDETVVRALAAKEAEATV
jgi:Spy/CpxP family protein refolding chaperone